MFVIVPSGSVALKERTTGVPVGELVVDKLTPIIGGLSVICIDDDADAVSVALSVTVSVTT